MVHAGQRGHVNVGKLAAGQAEERIDRQLKGGHGALDLKLLERGGVDVANPAQQLALGQDLGRTTGLQMPVLGGVGHLEAHLGNAQGAQELLHDALGIKEVQREVATVPGVLVPGAAQHTAHVGGLVGEALVVATKEHAADFVEGHVVHAVGLVVGKRGQKAGNE